MTKNFKTTTPEGNEGINISYKAEKNLAEKLLNVLPEGWSVEGGWSQILFDADVKWRIDTDKKVIHYIYNSNLGHYTNEMVDEIGQRVKELLDEEK